MPASLPRRTSRIRLGLFTLFQFFIAHAGLTNLDLKETQETYVDWNTGMRRTKTEFDLSLDNRSLNLDTIKNAINKNHPDLLTYPSLLDAKTLGKDDHLLILSRDSQGQPYPVVRVKKEKGQVQISLVEVNGIGSPYSWFPDSRLDGWIRVFAKDHSQFMIQSSTFKKVNIGKGNLAKVNHPHAFMAEEKDGELVFSVISLENGNEVTRLSLGKDCYALPSFSFDHPKLERHNNSKNDDNINYNYGPEWWDKNFEFNPNKPPSLTLKAQHVLTAPAQKELVLRYEEEEIDQLLMMNKDCSKINPKGSEKAAKNYSSMIGTTVQEFCLTQTDLVPKENASGCGKVNRKILFKNGPVSVSQVMFDYHSKKLKKTFPISIPELTVTGRPYLHLTNPEPYRGIDLIHHAEVVNENNILIRARNSGPWHLYLVTVKEGLYDLQLVETFAYPGSKEERTLNDKFIYNHTGRLLVSRNPLKIWKRISGLIHVQDGVVFTSYHDRDGLNIFGLKLKDGGDTKLLWSGHISGSCEKSLKVPNLEADLSSREKWFMKTFNWNVQKNKLELVQEKKNCVLLPVKN